MANAHCVCPQFLQDHIKNSSVYTTYFIGQLIYTEDQIVLDREEILISAYFNAVKEDPEAFQNFSVWKRILDSQPQGKMLLSNSGAAISGPEAVFNTISPAITRHDKAIIAADNNHYADLFEDIQRCGINLLNLNSLYGARLDIQSQGIIGFTKFESDLGWVLERLGRTCRKNYSEDEDNDYLRDLLDAKGYQLRDQTREGKSASGKSAGELDLAVLNRGHLFTVVEAMKLSAVKEAYIDEHYKKLNTNYNPMAVKRTYLITYYTGKNFQDWWKKYKAYIEELEPSKFSSKEMCSNDSIEDIETNLHGLKKLYNHITIDAERLVCVHFAIRIES